MILDRLINADKYGSLHHHFPAAFDFLRKDKLDTMALGRFYIEGDSLYGGVVRETGRGLQGVRLEVHRKYIDIHFPLGSGDVIGWKDKASCQENGKGYDDEKDVEYYLGEPDVWIKVPPRTFTIFFPEDAHAPMATDFEVFKIIIKVDLYS